MARSFARVKLAVYQRVLVLSLTSAVLTIFSTGISPIVTALLLIPALPGLGLVSAAGGAALGYSILRMYLAMGVTGIAMLLVTKLRWPALVLVGVALAMLLSLPRAYPFFEKSLTDSTRRRLNRNRISAYTALIAAMALLLYAM